MLHIFKMKKNQARKKYTDLRDKLNDLELKKLSNQIYEHGFPNKTKLSMIIFLQIYLITNDE